MAENEDTIPTPVDDVPPKQSNASSPVSFEMESVKTPLLKQPNDRSSNPETVINVATVESTADIAPSDPVAGAGDAAESSRNSTPLTRSHVEVSATSNAGGYPMTQQGPSGYPHGGGGGASQSPYSLQQQAAYGAGGGYGYGQQPPAPYGGAPNPAIMQVEGGDDLQKPGTSTSNNGAGYGAGPSGYGGGPARAPSKLSEKPDAEVAEEAEPEVGDMILVGLSYIILVLLFPLAIFQAIKVLNTYEKAVIFRLGKVKSRETPSGVVFQLPCTDDLTRVDVRTRSINVPPQEILTRDSVTCRVDGIVFYEVIDPIKSVTKVEDVAQSVALSAQTALRTVLGYRTLPEILAAKMAITHDILEIVEERAHSWGVRVLRVDLKDMLLAPQLQRALVAEAETARSAKAQVIRADGEHKAAEILSKASAILNDSKVGVQLRYLQTLNQISGTNNKTVVLPLPPVLAERAIGGLVNSLRK